jgi:hypothetical protein
MMVANITVVSLLMKSHRFILSFQEIQRLKIVSIVSDEEANVFQQDL